MDVVVANLSESGEEIPFTSDLDWTLSVVRQVLEGEALSFAGAIHLRARRQRVEVTGELNAAAKCECERCGEVFEMSVKAPVQLSYVPAETQGMTGERELAETELDLGWYSDGRISVSDIISEALALALPERTICLNVEGCDKRTAALLAAAREDAPTGHPGFAALKDL